MTVSDPARLVDMGERIERQGDLLAATVFYERALDLSPDQPLALRAAANNALKRGAIAVAAHYFAAWADAEPRNPEALIGLASGLTFEGRSREALAALQRAADLGGAKASIAAQRGLALDLEGDAATAQAAYAEALNANPADPITTQRMAISLALGGDNGAAMTLLQRFGAEPESAEVRRTLATVHALGGRLESAADIAASLMPIAQARRMQDFYAQLSRLTPRERAFAAHFGVLPASRPVTPSKPVLASSALAAPPVAVATPATTTAGQPPLSPQLLKARPRLWVQLVSMTDPGKLPGEWQRIRKMAGGSIDGQVAYVQRAGALNRLLIGPFASDGAARNMVASLKARRLPAVLNRTPAGADIGALN